MWSPQKLQMPNAFDALPGREQRMKVAERHVVLGTPLDDKFEGLELALLGFGCFWGAEKKLWQLKGVKSTQVGYAGGFTKNPTYEEVCSGKTGHAEVVRVAFDPGVLSFEAMLRVFWESHDPTQGMQQGNDIGTQYRSAIYFYTPLQQQIASVSRLAYQHSLYAQGYGAITTELKPAGEFYFAENEHQQYLAKNPQGYCGLGGTGVSFPTEPVRDSSEFMLPQT